jgi:hypothetical protein
MQRWPVDHGTYSINIEHPEDTPNVSSRYSTSGPGICRRRKDVCVCEIPGGLHTRKNSKVEIGLNVLKTNALVLEPQYNLKRRNSS